MKPARPSAAVGLGFATIMVAMCCDSSSIAIDANRQAVTYRRFQVVQRDGRVAAVEPIPAELAPKWARDVVQREADWAAQSPGATPYFAEPLPFVLPRKAH